MRWLVLMAGLSVLAACAGERPVKWSASSWNSVPVQTIGAANNTFYAALPEG